MRYWKLLRFIYHIQVVLCVLFFTYIICNSYVVCKSKRKRASPSSTLLLSRNDRKLINPQNKMKGKNKFCLYELKLWQRWEPKKVYIFIFVKYLRFQRQLLFTKKIWKYFQISNWSTIFVYCLNSFRKWYLFSSFLNLRWTERQIWWSCITFYLYKD